MCAVWTECTEASRVHNVSSVHIACCVGPGCSVCTVRTVYNECIACSVHTVCNADNIYHCVHRASWTQCTLCIDWTRSTQLPHFPIAHTVQIEHTVHITQRVHSLRCMSSARSPLVHCEQSAHSVGYVKCAHCIQCGQVRTVDTMDECVVYIACNADVHSAYKVHTPAQCVQLSLIHI